MPPAPSDPNTPSARVASIDIVRGAVMVLMAIDHVRVYAGVPAGGITADVFLTRWVTHFCAPVFVFLAGTSAYLHGAKLGDPRVLSRWLLLRGAWLVVLELTVFRLAWTFNTGFGSYMLAGVIWMLGWCMILMAGLVRLPLWCSGAVGVVMIGAHNLTGLLSRETLRAVSESDWNWLASIAYFGGGLRLGGAEAPNFLILYSIIPWIGVMAAGYAFGRVMQLPAERRRAVCMAAGAGAVAAFLVLRYVNVYGDPRPWTPHPEQVPAWIAFLNTAKYPASLLFLLMTLGPAILAMAFLDQARGRVAGWLTVFGKVPFFYYLLHIPLIHVVALLIALVRTPDAVSWMFADHPMNPGRAPDGYRWSLPLLYAVFAGVVVALYFPCRWFAELKARRRDPWLSYL